MYHEHPLRILKYSMKNIWLLIFPIIRAVYQYRVHIDKNWFYTWIKGAWLDIAIIGAIIIFGFIRWYFSVIDFTGDEIVHRDGVFIRVNTFIPISNISSATLERPFYLTPFGATRFCCDTRAGILKANDLKLLVNKKTCAEILKTMPQIDENDMIEGIPRPSLMSVLMFSVFFSSGFSGTIYIATFFWKAGDISYDIITRYLNRFTEETEKLTNRLLLKIPTAAAAVGLFFIGSWLISFIVNLFRYSGFDIESDKRCVKITYGLLDRKEYRIKASHINYTDLRQNLIMKLFRAVSVNISCPGYGATKNRLPVLLPVKKEKNIGKELEVIGVFGGIKNDFRPKASGVGSYLLIPLVAAAEIYPAHDLIARLFPKFSELSKFIAIMLEIPAIWLIAVKFAALLTSGIAFCGSKVIVRSCIWTNFHTVAAERNKVAKIELQQNFLQKLGRKCNISIWFEGEERKRYRVRAMSVEDAKRITQLLEYDIGIKMDAPLDKFAKK